MIRYTFYTSLGQYTQTGITTDPLSDGDIPDGHSVYYDAVNPETQYHNIELDQPVDMPTKPGEYYKFDYSDKTWKPDLSRAASQAWYKRQRLLAESDWTDTVSAQARLGSAYATWQTYRQALRDITSQPGYPISIEWPHVPQ